ncbi:rCG47425 [Rattus norvegicus]|uniref:RCG47425 n=1 Tax=Rattus norvegicus TaxID=10116 RepID=A6HXB0_RAT|nr:rCG47425 [Rattus norvegicus]
MPALRRWDRLVISKPSSTISSLGAPSPLLEPVGGYSWLSDLTSCLLQRVTVTLRIWTCAQEKVRKGGKCSPYEGNKQSCTEIAKISG